MVLIRIWKHYRRYAIEDIRSAIKFCVSVNMMLMNTFKFTLSGRHEYSTVKYTDNSRDSRKEKLEWKIRIQHDPYSLDLVPFDFAFFAN